MASSSTAESVVLLQDRASQQRKGFGHRDVKPQNILVDQDERVYLVDFGLALADQDVCKRLPAGGTPAYMSPEQARGEGHRVDGCSDLFSLGILFYEMLCGRRPFQGNSLLELLEQVTDLDPKPLRQWEDSVPQELERICMKMLPLQATQTEARLRMQGDAMETRRNGLLDKMNFPPIVGIGTYLGITLVEHIRKQPSLI